MLKKLWFSSILGKKFAVWLYFSLGFFTQAACIFLNWHKWITGDTLGYLEIICMSNLITVVLQGSLVVLRRIKWTIRFSKMSYVIFKRIIRSTIDLKPGSNGSIVNLLGCLAPPKINKNPVDVPWALWMINLFSYWAKESLNCH